MVNISDSEPSDQPKNRSEKIIWRWVDFSSKHSGKILLAFVILALLAGLLATRIHLDANLESLLPQKSKTILAMKETKQRFGSADLFTISIVMKDPIEIAHIQDGIRKEMQTHWDDAVTVQVDRDGSFFKKHALLYLPDSELVKLETRLAAKRDEIKLGPLGVDLLSDAPPVPKGPWFNANTPQQLGLPDEAADQFRKFLKTDDTTKTKTQEVDRKEGVPDSLKSRLIGRLDDGRYVGLVQAVLKNPSSNMDYVKTVLARSKVMLGAYESKFGDQLQIGVEGPYKNLSDVESLATNGSIATVISIGLTLLIVLLYFRTTGPLFLVLGQAAISCMFTLGFVSLTFGRLNLYTIFVIAILFGMGTDFSLYVMGYSQRMFRKGMHWNLALARTLSDLLSSLFTAWITTVAGLLTLLSSRFAGFYEFGLIATAGMTFSLILTYVFLPAAILWTRNLSTHSLFGWLRIESKKLHAPSNVEPKWLPRLAASTAAFAIIGAIILLPFVFKVQFEYDFSNLSESNKSWAKSIISTTKKALPFLGTQDSAVNKPKRLPISEAIGTNRTSSQPVVLLANSPEAMDEVYDTLLNRLTVQHDSLLRSFLTLRSFVPRAQDQAARAIHLARIDSIVSDKIFNKASGEDSSMVAMIRDMAKAKTFTAEEIPSWALDLLRERDGKYGRIGFIYSRFNSSDAQEAQLFEDRYSHFSSKGKDITCYSSSFVYADLVRLVREDSVRMSILMLIILCILLVLILRKTGPILVCFLGMFISLVWTLGLMGLLHQRVGIFNLIVITTIQAALTDVVIYVVLAWERQKRQGLREIYSGMGMLMSVAIGTTIAGYAGMLFTSHLGIQSMGTFAVIGLCACLATSLCVTPWLCTKLLKNKQ